MGSRGVVRGQCVCWSYLDSANKQGRQDQRMLEPLMLRRLSIGLLASAVAIAPLPLKAQDGTAEDLGVMSVSLKDVVKPRVGFQGALQGAGTPNQAGIGGFLPLSVGDNSVFFADVLANANFADFNNYSSIINTTVAGTTISTSSRLGYRWLNGDRSWMYGLNAGYDTRPMTTGYADTGISIFGTEKTVFFQQAAVNAEAVSDRWKLNAYALIPTGDTDYQVNWLYSAGALNTYGLDAGYNVTSTLLASVGSYYQNGDVDADGNPEVDNVGIVGRLAYAINSELTLGANASYDTSFDTRFSADIKWRFNTSGSPSTETPKTNNAIKALTSTPGNRDIRVHDAIELYNGKVVVEPNLVCRDEFAEDCYYKNFGIVDRNGTLYISGDNIVVFFRD